MLALTITRQTLYGGLVDGLSIGLLALGVVLIYRSNRVINFAVGALGAFSAALLALLVIKYNWNYWLAVTVAVLAGGAFAAAVEATVITRLFRAPRVIVLVATIGIAELALAAQTALPDLDAGIDTRYPTPVADTWEVAGVQVRGAELAVLLTVPVLAVLLTLFLTRTSIGKAIRAAAADPDSPVCPPSARRCSRPSSGRSAGCSRQSRSSCWPERRAASSVSRRLARTP